MQQSSYWVVIPAAGSGQRFNQSVPKQYTVINGKTVLEHTLALYLRLTWIKKIVLCLAPNAEHFTHLVCKSPEKIQVIPGGLTRAESVFNAINYLSTHAQDHDWILTHDAVRPCLHIADLTQLVEQLKFDEVGGILATPVNDTLKIFKEGTMQTMNRDHLWHALTPQLFRYNQLKAALAYCLAQQREVTDEASALEQYGCAIKMVQAQYANPKLTYLGDLPLISYLLQQLSNEVTST